MTVRALRHTSSEGRCLLLKEDHCLLYQTRSREVEALLTELSLADILSCYSASQRGRTDSKKSFCV